MWTGTEESCSSSLLQPLGHSSPGSGTQRLPAHSSSNQPPPHPTPPPGVTWPSVFKKLKSRWGAEVALPNDLKLQISEGKTASIAQQLVYTTQSFKTSYETWNSSYTVLTLQVIFPNKQYCTETVLLWLLFQFQRRDRYTINLRKWHRECVHRNTSWWEK